MTVQLLKDVAFTDPAGNVISAATFQLINANLQATNNAEFNVSLQDFATVTETSNPYNEMRCKFAYWISETTRTSGTNTPLWLANAEERTEFFRFDPSADIYDGLDLKKNA